MKGVTSQSLSKGQKHSYASDLPNSPLNLTHRAAIYIVFDDPHNVEERTSRLSKVAYEEGNEV